MLDHTLKEFQDTLMERDERVRTQVVEGTEYTIRADDPYGLWHVVSPKPPKDISGAYTGVNACWDAIKAYELKKKAKGASSGHRIETRDENGKRVKLPLEQIQAAIQARADIKEASAT